MSLVILKQKVLNPHPKRKKNCWRSGTGVPNKSIFGGIRFQKTDSRKPTPPSDSTRGTFGGIFFILLKMKFTIADRAMFICVLWISNRPTFGNDKLNLL